MLGVRGRGASGSITPAVLNNLHGTERPVLAMRRCRVPFRLTAFVLSVGLNACGSGVSEDPGTVEGEVVETPFAETFSVVERNGYRIA